MLELLLLHASAAVMPLDFDLATVGGDMDPAAIRFTVLDDDARGCGAKRAGEILVCAPPDEEAYRLGPSAPAAATLMEEAAQGLRLRLGPLEIGPQFRRAGSVGVGLRIVF